MSKEEVVCLIAFDGILMDFFFNLGRGLESESDVSLSKEEVVCFIAVDDILIDFFLNLGRGVAGLGLIFSRLRDFRHHNLWVAFAV